MHWQRRPFVLGALVLALVGLLVLCERPTHALGQGLEIVPQQAAETKKADESVATDTAHRKEWVTIAWDYALATVPRVVIIVIVLLIAQYGISLVGRRLIRLWSGSDRGTAEEGRYRAQTLVSVFENAVTTALYTIGVISILDALKVPVSTLLGGVAVVGLAVAFGAQNLIRDYFYGFMILLEDQYKINDVVSINSMTGQVERFTLRITVLRDYDGKVFFIPNGQINSVTNMTHEWSRVVLDVPVAYKENVERVMAVLLELAQGLASDPSFKNGVLKEPELVGVDKLADSAVIVRICFVTRPSQKDSVRREMLKRIKARFDELDIEIPFAQHVVHYRPITSDQALRDGSRVDEDSEPSDAPKP
jgi:small-conductance mechanosensitive channel